MKYYTLRNRVMEMEDKFFPHLLANEPKAVELTKKEYDEYRSFESFRGGGERVEDEPEAVREDTEEAVSSTFQGTKAEAEKILKERGFSPGQLRGKRKDELIQML